LVSFFLFAVYCFLLPYFLKINDSNNAFIIA
jgi:hypothetical protein